MSEKSTLADRLRENLADQIVNGELRPGTRLDEIELATKFGMSRTPVREAFKELAGMGLVEQRPHRGVVVALPIRKRMAEMFEVIGQIDATCALLHAVRTIGLSMVRGRGFRDIVFSVEDG